MNNFQIYRNARSLTFNIVQKFVIIISYQNSGISETYQLFQPLRYNKVK